MFANVLTTRAVKITIHHMQREHRRPDNHRNRHGKELQAEEFPMPGNGKQHRKKNKARRPEWRSKNCGVREPWIHIT